MIVVQNASSVPPARNSKAEKKKNLLFKQGVKPVSSAEEEKAKKNKTKRKLKPCTTIPANSELVSREWGSGEKRKEAIFSLPLFSISMQQACLVQVVRA